MIETGNQRTFNFIIFVILALGAILALAPMLYMVGTAFRGQSYIQEIPPRFIPENPTLENFQTAFNSRNFGRAFLNSAGVAVSTASLVTLLATMMAYGFARYDFPGKNPLFFTMLGMLMVPGITFIIPQFMVAKTLGLLNSLPGMVLVYTAGPLAFNTFLLRGFFENLPRELEESAMIDGANAWTIFLQIMVPLAAPAVSTVAVFSFLGAWDEYILALTFLTDESVRTLPIAIANFQGVNATNWGLIFAASLTAVIPNIILFIVFQRYFVQGLTTGAVRG